MNLSDLNERFAIDGVLNFGQDDNQLLYAEIAGPAARARVYMQGAHLTAWQPHGFDPVIYLSPKSEFQQGRPIRGGIPVVFPWFGPRRGEPAPPHADEPGLQHGFARVQEWVMVFAALSGEDVNLTLALGPTKESQAVGFDDFRAALRLRIGRSLAVELAVANGEGRPPLVFEEALHTYFQVANATQVSVEGLGGAEYIDKRDGFRRKVLPAGPLRLTEETDRVFLNTEAACIIHDPVGGRRITVGKAGSRTTVVWNPWTTLAPQLPDMDPEGWRSMIAVETGNVGPDAVTLAAGERHAMAFDVAVEKVG
jgi:glucose-6-phosphate 1-epimerase